MGNRDMTKEKYLKELKKKLKSQFKKEEVDNVVDDYSEYFDIAMTQGKTEAVICDILGDPNNIVKKLVEEAGEKESYMSVSIKKSFLYKAATLLLIFFVGVILITMFRKSHTIKLSYLIIGYPLIVLVGGILIGRTPFRQLHNGSEKNWIISNVIKLLIAAHGFCFFLTLSIVIGIFSITDTDNMQYIIHLYGYKIGPLIAKIFYLSGIILVVIIVFAGFQVIKNHHLSYYSLICHAMGSLTMLIGYDSIHKNLTTVDEYRGLVIQSSLIYLETLLIVLFFVLIYRRRGIYGRTT